MPNSRLNLIYLSFFVQYITSDECHAWFHLYGTSRPARSASKATKYKMTKVLPTVGLEPTALKYVARCSTDWATRALMKTLLLKWSLLVWLLYIITYLVSSRPYIEICRVRKIYGRRGGAEPSIYFTNPTYFYVRSGTDQISVLFRRGPFSVYAVLRNLRKIHSHCR